MEEEIYQQINLIKLEDVNFLSLEEIRGKLDTKIWENNSWRWKFDKTILLSLANITTTLGIMKSILVCFMINQLIP